MAVCAGNHFIERRQIIVVMLVVIPVGLCYAPARRLFFLQGFKAFFLFFFRDVEKEFDKHIAVVCDLMFKIDDLIITVIQLTTRKRFILARHRNLPVPATVE